MYLVYSICMSLIFITAHAYLPPVSFHDSMASYGGHDHVFAQYDNAWILAEKLYNNYFDECHSMQDPIPHIIHHIWLGSDLPAYAVNFRQTWFKYHPTWTFIIWMDQPSLSHGAIILQSVQELQEHLATPDHEQYIVMDIRNIELYNQVAFAERATNYGEKSDILRYEILAWLGGLYIDTDFECLRPFDDIHEHCDFYTGISHTVKFILYNGLIGSKPNHHILDICIAQLHDRPHYSNSLDYSGPHYFTDCFLQGAALNHERVVAFPVTFLYPWPHMFRAQSYEQAREWIRPESYGLHYWKVSWAR